MKMFLLAALAAFGLTACSTFAETDTQTKRCYRTVQTKAPYRIPIACPLTPGQHSALEISLLSNT